MLDPVSADLIALMGCREGSDRSFGMLVEVTVSMSDITKAGAVAGAGGAAEARRHGGA